MKKLKAALLVFTVLIGFGFTKEAEARSEVTLDIFYEALSPYGEWIEHEYYGYIWQPVGVDEYWKPYRDGNWQYSDEGWIWVSEEPWGWATYHYGRWVPDDYYGWVWIPGVDWAPAYVDWYESPGSYDSPGYIGWTPRPPDKSFFLEIGIGSAGFGYYESGYAFNFSYYKPYKPYRKKHYKKHYYKHSHYYPPPERCVYVPYKHFGRKNAKFVAVDNHNTVVYRNTTNITNVTYINNKKVYKGPERHYVERRAGKKFNRVNLIERDKVVYRGGRDLNRVKDNGYEVYRPKIVKKGYEKPKSISRLHKGKKSHSAASQFKSIKAKNTSSQNGTVYRNTQDLRTGFTSRKSQKGASSYRSETKKKESANSRLSGIKEKKTYTNKNKNYSPEYRINKAANSYKKTSKKSEHKRNTPKIQRTPLSQEKYVTGKSRNIDGPRGYQNKGVYQNKSVKNSKPVYKSQKSYKPQKKSLVPAKSKRQQTAYKSQKPKLKSRSANQTIQNAQHRNYNKNSSYKKSQKKNTTRAGSNRGLKNSSVRKSFNNSGNSFNNSPRNSLNKRARR